MGARSSISSFFERVARLFRHQETEQAPGPAPIPVTCLRSLRKPGWLTEDGYISYEAFMDEPKTEKARAEKGKTPGTEVSINWEDDSSVLEFTFRMRPSDVGVAKLPVSEVYEQNKKPGSIDMLSIERDPLEDNKYHGNIVYKCSRDRHRVRMLAGVLAMASKPIKRPK